MFLLYTEYIRGKYIFEVSKNSFKYRSENNFIELIKIIM